MRVVLWALPAISAISLLACSGQKSPPTQTQHGLSDASASAAGECGTPEARTKCESVTWPRLIVAFGDEGARALEYSVTTDDGLRFDDEYLPCPSGYGESSGFRCDLGYYGSAKQMRFTLHIAAEKDGSLLISREIPLTEFNYCGRGVAYVIVTTSDAGRADPPALSEVRYISVCESL